MELFYGRDALNVLKSVAKILAFEWKATHFYFYAELFNITNSVVWSILSLLDGQENLEMVVLSAVLKNMDFMYTATIVLR